MTERKSRTEANQFPDGLPNGRASSPAHVRPPLRRPGLIERVELTRHVTYAAVSKRLVLVSAASGFGKTSLLADAHRQLSDMHQPCIWLSIAEGDHDASWLSRMLVGQLAQLYQAVAQSDEDFGQLANRVVGDDPVIVFVDNWNFIETDVSNRLFDRLLTETEGLANFIVSSRTVPGFMFESLRLADSFAGFGAKDLAFTTEEAALILADTVKGPLSLPVFGLIGRTEGWPAGVQLLRLAIEQAGGELSSSFDFSGSRSDVANYLGKAFFRYLPAHTRALLCNIAVLDQMTPALVALVIGDAAAASEFADIERENLFLAEAAEGSGRFRFHSMFRDFLLSQRDAEATMDEAVILTRAQQWHIDHSEIEQAISYAMRVGNGVALLALLEDYAATRLTSEGKTHLFAQWVEALRLSGVPLTESIDHWYCWSLVFSGRWREAIAFSKTLGLAPDVQIASVTAAFSDDQPALRALVDQWRSEGGEGDPHKVAVMQCVIAVGAMAQGQIDAAIDATHLARFAINRTDVIFGRIWTQVLTAFALLLKGRATEGEAHVRDAIRLGERMLGPGAPVTRVARLMAAIIAWYRCSDQRAITDLRTAEMCADEHGLPMIVVGASSVARALGLDWTKRHLENHLQSLAIALVREAYRVEALLQHECPVERAQAAVAVFDLQLADARERHPDILVDGWMLHDISVGIHARLFLIRGEAEEALGILNPALNECQRRGRGLAEQHLALLKASALVMLDRRANALRLVIQTAEKAVKGGLLRPFIGERRFIESLFPDLLDAGERVPLGNDPEAWSAFCTMLNIDRPGLGEHGPSLDSEMAQITDREREMLYYLEKGLSNQEIGSRLGISVPTVKWHLHNIFSKIQVRNRSSAARFARENNLV